MDKRILIFSPYKEDQEAIESFIIDYFNKNLHGISGIDVQIFQSIGDSIDSGNKIGMGGEVLVIFGSNLYPESEYMNLDKPRTIDKNMYGKFLEATFKSSRNLCIEKEIPYIMYEREIEQGQVNSLISKLNKENKGIENRLNELERKIAQELSPYSF